VVTTITERKPLSIFMTGGDTPLGLAVIKHLIAAGHQVAAQTQGADNSGIIRALGALPVYADESRVGEVKGIVSMRKVDVVMNLETQASNHPPFVGANWEAENLVEDAEALVNGAAQGGAKFYVHTSYAFVYGDHHGAWVDETTPPTPGDNTLLKEALRAEKKALSGVIPACVLRLGYLYGEDSAPFEGLVDSVRGARPVVSGEGVANWVHISDAAEAIRRAVEAQIAGGIYNIVDGTPATSASFIRNLAGALGVTPPNNPPKFLNGFLTSKTQTDLMALSARVRNSRAIEELGWTPRFNSHQEGIEDVLLSWRAEQAQTSAIVVAE
jgi:nucleoside-diphosphate-sugar epimerase